MIDLTYPKKKNLILSTFPAYGYCDKSVIKVEGIVTLKGGAESVKSMLHYFAKAGDRRLFCVIFRGLTVVEGKYDLEITTTLNNGVKQSKKVGKLELDESGQAIQMQHPASHDALSSDFFPYGDTNQTTSLQCIKLFDGGNVHAQGSQSYLEDGFWIADFIGVDAKSGLTLTVSHEVSCANGASATDLDVS